MAKIQAMNIIFALFLALFIYQMSIIEGRQIKSQNVIRINYTENPSPKSARKLGRQSTMSENSETSLVKITPKKPSLDFSQVAADKKMLHSSEPVQLQASSRTVNVQNNCIGMNCPDDFRPTAPGHSPGAGHSYGPSTNAEPNQLTKGTLRESRRKPNLNTADVQNNFHSFISDNEIVYNNDFRPTSPGSSGHEAKNKDTRTKDHCLHNKCTEDFPPTAPGDTPGAAHFSEGESDSRASNNEAKAIGVAKFYEEDTDGYRPTAPGHSPGAGH